MDILWSVAPLIFVQRWFGENWGSLTALDYLPAIITVCIVALVMLSRGALFLLSSISGSYLGSSASPIAERTWHWQNRGRVVRFLFGQPDSSDRSRHDDCN